MTAIGFTLTGIAFVVIGGWIAYTETRLDILERRSTYDPAWEAEQKRQGRADLGRGM